MIVTNNQLEAKAKQCKQSLIVRLQANCADQELVSTAESLLDSFIHELRKELL